MWLIKGKFTTLVGSGKTSWGGEERPTECKVEMRTPEKRAMAQRDHPKVKTK